MSIEAARAVKAEKDSCRRTDLLLRLRAILAKDEYARHGQIQLAARLGTSQSTVSRLLRWLDDQSA